MTLRITSHNRSRRPAVSLRLALVVVAGAAAAVPDCARAQRSAAGGVTTQGAPAPFSGVIRTDTLWAQSLGTRKALTVYLPPSYAAATSRRYPVLYYLHGMWGDERNWIDAGALGATLDSLTRAGKPEAIVVMPDGDDGWYSTWFTLPDMASCQSDTSRKEAAARYCVPWPHYDDYIARDLVAYVDRTYRTQAEARHRGIAGLSMGGYGAITLALRYPDVFQAAASHSGVVAPLYTGPVPYAEPARYARDSAELRVAASGLWPAMRRVFGRDTLSWWANDPGRLAARTIERAKTGGAPLPALMLDCGVADRYIDQNRAFHATLTRLGITHRYAEWPGVHDWKYWRAHAAESVTFLLTALHADAGPR